MPRPQKKIPQTDESETGERARLITIAVILFVSLFIAYIYHLLSTNEAHPNLGAQFQSDAEIALVTVAIGELFAILWISLSAGFRKLPTSVSDLSSKFQNLHDIEYLIHELQIADQKYVGKPAHIAAVTSLNSFLKTVELKDERISVEGDYSSRELYEEFWKQILVEQTRLHRAKASQGIRVFLTHSASIRLWETHQFREIRNRQKDFAQKGGEIYRILIRKTSSDDSDHREIYERVLKDMRATSNIHAFFLPAADHEMDGHDYFFCEFGGRYFTFVWTLDKEAAGVRGITKTEISILHNHYKREYHEKWQDVMEALEAWQPDKALSDILRKKPDGEVLAIMKNLG